MRIIKPNRSIVQDNERKISVGTKVTKADEVTDALKFLQESEEFFIAQWISILDKIFPKPKNKKPTPKVETARDKLSEAFIEIWKSKGLKAKTSWYNKVHPYQKHKTTCNKKIYKSYWYKKLIGDKIEIKDINYAKVAGTVYQHLYKEQANKSNKKSVIENRAISIKNNAHKFKIENNFLKSLSIEQQRHIKTLKNRFSLHEQLADYKLLELVELLKAKQNKENNKIGSKNIARCLFKHYGNIFGEKTKIKELLTPKHEHHHLFLYHSIIKVALEQQYPKRAYQNKKFKKIEANNLHKVAVDIEKNKMMAFAIRLGKVIHYDNTEGDLQSVQDFSNIAQSQYWNSEGQTQIKQKEAFILQWLGVVSVANSTLRGLINPQSVNDLFSEKEFNKELQNINEDFGTRFKLLFGQESNLYEQNSRDKFLRHLRTTIATIRNSSFHFKDESSFKDALNENYTNAGKQNRLVEDYIKKQLQKQKALVIASLKSAHIKKYLNQNQANKFFKELNNNKANKFILPKFSKLLRRAKNNKKLLIEPYNQVEQKLNPAKNCQFVLLKKLYESSFDDWLDNQKINTINEFIEQAKNYTTKKAQDMNQKNALEGEEIVSKATKEIKQIVEGETLMQYFSDLAQKTASLFVVQQNVYESDSENAKDQATFVNNFKMDFLALAFDKYLQDKQLNFLLSIKNEQGCELQTNLLEEKSMLKRPWIYLILHLMPANSVNNLSLQLKKYHILKGEVIFDGIVKAIDLYLSMHNAIQEDTTLEGTELNTFYDNKQNFTHLFSQTNNEQLIPVKGLRELLRFGNLEQLKSIFANNKITNNQVAELLNKQTEIINHQQEKAKLHNKLCKQKPLQRNKKEVKDYKKCLDKVTQYNHLKNHIYLINHQKTHQLIMTIAGRFVGFAQLWERDLYFIMLSILALKNIKTKKWFYETNKEQVSFAELINKGQTSSTFTKIKAKGIKAIKDEKVLYQALDYLFFISSNSQIRNNFTHFNDLREDNINLTTMLNNARKLMHYDRKLKNAVAKSIKNIVSKENLIIKFEVNKNDKFYNLDCISIKTDCAKHLKESDIKENLNSKQYVIAVKKLFRVK